MAQQPITPQPPMAQQSIPPHPIVPPLPPIEPHPIEPKRFPQPFSSDNPHPVEIKQHANSPGLKPFVPKLIESRVLHQSVRGVWKVGLISLIAWITAVSAPIVGVVRLFDGLIALIPDMVNGTLTGVSMDVIGNFGMDQGMFSGFAWFWDVTTNISGTTRVEFGKLALGFLVLFVALITLLCLMVALRTNWRAGRVLLIVNFGLCALADWMSYSVIRQIVDVIEYLPPPYDNAPLLVLFCAGGAAALGIIGFIIYSRFIARSNEIYAVPFRHVA